MDTTAYHLCFDDGANWQFRASEKTRPWVEAFATAMGLSRGGNADTLAVTFEEILVKRGERLDPVVRLDRERYGDMPEEGWHVEGFKDVVLYEHPQVGIIYGLLPDATRKGWKDQMRRSLLPLFRRGVLSGELPLHAALVEREGAGVILAASSGVGKSTCCRRLPPPWRALAEDLCQVVVSEDRGYRVHPLPTWSALDPDAPGEGRCVASCSVPLRAVFFIEQAQGDECIAFDKVRSAAALARCSLEVFRSVTGHFRLRYESTDVKRAIYNNAASLALAMPCYLLRLSLQGRFWDKIEEVLEKGDSPHFSRHVGKTPVFPSPPGSKSCCGKSCKEKNNYLVRLDTRGIHTAGAGRGGS